MNLRNMLQTNLIFEVSNKNSSPQKIVDKITIVTQKIWVKNECKGKRFKNRE